MTLRVTSVPAGSRSAPSPKVNVQVAPVAQRAVDGFESVAQKRVSMGRGTTGAAVRSLQQKLVTRGYLSRADMATGAGVFGPRTEAAVQRLQTGAGLPPTGVVDARTLAALTEPLRAPSFIEETPTDRFSSSLLNRMADTVTDDEPTAGTSPAP
jgi:peptidoglycan hydrolase-like protein with peptidoglycan-binding domain